MKTNKKKIIILVSLVVLLVATGVLNYFLNLRAKPEEDDMTTPTFFMSYREDREATRAEEILYLDSIITSATSDEATIAAAQETKLALIDIMEMELALEGLIKARGFEDCIVTISTENINVVVKCDDELTPQESAQILNIIVTETPYTAVNSILVPYY